jgi:hypothetical protein
LLTAPSASATYVLRSSNRALPSGATTHTHLSSAVRRLHDQPVPVASERPLAEHPEDRLRLQERRL